MIRFKVGDTVQVFGSSLDGVLLHKKKLRVCKERRPKDPSGIFYVKYEKKVCKVHACQVRLIKRYNHKEKTPKLNPSREIYINESYYGRDFFTELLMLTRSEKISVSRPDNTRGWVLIAEYKKF